MISKQNDFFFSSKITLHFFRFKKYGKSICLMITKSSSSSSSKYSLFTFFVVVDDLLIFPTWDYFISISLAKIFNHILMIMIIGDNNIYLFNSQYNFIFFCQQQQQPNVISDQLIINRSYLSLLVL